MTFYQLPHAVVIGALYIFKKKKQNGFFQQLFHAVILGALQISKKKSQNDF